MNNITIKILALALLTAMHISIPAQSLQLMDDAATYREH